MIVGLIGILRTGQLHLSEYHSARAGVLEIVKGQCVHKV
jgi:hypothetical protein